MMAKLRLTKAQIWYTDFTVATLIIIIAILIYYGYVVNIAPQSKGSLNELLTDIDTISSSLISIGIPENWNKDTVQRIGLTNNARSIQQNKLEEFQDIKYNQSRKLFSTRFDYVVFFERKNGTIIDIDNECAIGKPELISEEDGVCQKPNITLANPKKLVKATRFALYSNDIIRIVVYVFE